MDCGSRFGSQSSSGTTSKAASLCLASKLNEKDKEPPLESKQSVAEEEGIAEEPSEKMEEELVEPTPGEGMDFSRWPQRQPAELSMRDTVRMYADTHKVSRRKAERQLLGVFRRPG